MTSSRQLPWWEPTRCITLLAAVAFSALQAEATAFAPPIDGYGNSLVDASRGSTGSPFIRRGSMAFYADRVGSIDSTLPNARAISTELFARQPFKYNSHAVSYLVAVWGQFMAHDMLMTSPHNATAGSPEVVTVAVPRCDRSMDRSCTGSQTLSFKRNLWDTSSGTGPLDPRVLLNSQTAFLDASTVYGATRNRLSQLRTFSGGLLREDSVNGAPPNLDNVFQAGPFPQQNQRLTGDPRGNVQPGLLAVHGLFILEHNRWARLLAEQNPNWSDESVFQAARKRVIAIIQTITYNEYLPILLGEALPAYAGYDPNVNPAVDVAFGLAAYRYGHSGINNMYLCLLADGSSCPAGHLLLRDSYFQPQYLDYMSAADLLRGLVMQPENAIDTSMVDDVRNFVEGVRADLAVYDIMRGRDAGLPSYSTTRSMYGLSRPRSYEDITDSIPVQQALRSLYGEDGVDRVDLWVGGLAESARTGAAFVSETFRQIIKDQFLRSRNGDRFHFENTELGHFEDGEFVPYFTDKERENLRRTRLSDVIKRNTDFTNAPANVFRVPDGVTVFGGGMGATAAVHDDGTTDVAGSDDAGSSSGELELQMRSFRVSDALSLEWYPPLEGDTTLTMTVTLQGTGWFAVGFGSGMADADVVLMRVVGGEAQLVDSVATGYMLPSADDSQDVELDKWSQEGGVTSFTWTRPLDTGDGDDKAIEFKTDGDETAMIFAWSPSSTDLLPHGPNRIAGSVDLHSAYYEVTGGNGTSGGGGGGGGGGFSAALLAEEAFKQRLRQFGFHGLSMFSTWSILVPAAVMCVRFFKHVKSWLAFHRWAMMMAGTLTIPAIGAALGAGGGEGVIAHATMGLSIGTFMLVQMINGASLRNALRADRAPGTWFKTMKFVHRAMGWVLVLAALGNCYIGVTLLLPTAKYYVLGYFVTLIGVYLIVSILDECKRDRLSQPRFLMGAGGKMALQIDKEKLASCSQTLTMTDIRKNVRAGCKWVILNDMVFDIGGFAKHHPGGSYLIENNLGTDITQYFFGRAGYDKVSGRHVHSYKAHRMLASLVVGALAKQEMSEEKGGVGGVETASWLHMPQLETESGELWRLNRRRVVSDNANRPVVRLEFTHPMAPGARAVNWAPSTLGRYVTVRLHSGGAAGDVSGDKTATTGGLKRTASWFSRKGKPGPTSVAPQDGSSLALVEVGAAGGGGRRGNLVGDLPPDARGVVERPYTVVRRDGRDGFDMYIRRYPQGQMSPLMFGLREGSKVEMVGPKGLGLHLDNDAGGVVVCIAQGTGVCTYFELLQYIAACDSAQAGELVGSGQGGQPAKLRPRPEEGDVDSAAISVGAARKGAPVGYDSFSAGLPSGVGQPGGRLALQNSSDPTERGAHRRHRRHHDTESDSDSESDASSSSDGNRKHRRSRKGRRHRQRRKHRRHRKRHRHRDDTASETDSHDASGDSHHRRKQQPPPLEQVGESAAPVPAKAADSDMPTGVAPVDAPVSPDGPSSNPSDENEQEEAKEEGGQGSVSAAEGAAGAGADASPAPSPALVQSGMVRGRRVSGTQTELSPSHHQAAANLGILSTDDGSSVDERPARGQQPPPPPQHGRRHGNVLVVPDNAASSVGASAVDTSPVRRATDLQPGLTGQAPHLISVGSVTVTTAEEERRFQRARHRQMQAQMRGVALGSSTAAGSSSGGRRRLRCVLLACFTDESDVIERDWLLNLAKRSPNIELHVNVSRSNGSGRSIFDNFSTGRLSQDKLLEVLPPRNLHSVSICGSPAFNRTISDQYVLMGLPRTLISIT